MSIFSEILIFRKKTREKIVIRLKKQLNDIMYKNNQKQFEDFLHVIQNYGIIKHFDIKLLKKISIDLNQIQFFARLIKDNPEEIKFMLKSLDLFKHSKAVRKVIIEHKLDYKDDEFIKIRKHLTISFFIFLFKKKSVEILEDRATTCAFDLQTLLEMLYYKKKKLDLAYSVYQRHKDQYNVKFNC